MYRFLPARSFLKPGVIFLLFATWCAAQSSTPPSFTITPIPPLPQMQISGASAISGSGTVVGYSDPSAPDLTNTKVIPSVRGLLYANGALTDLGANVMPLAVNSSGQVLLLQSNPTMYTASLLYQNGNSQILTFFAQAINDSGDIAGTSLLPTDVVAANRYPVLFSKGTLTQLPTVSSGPGSAAGISANGIVCGTVIQNDTQFPVLWQDNVMTKLATGKGDSGQALAVNSSGMAVGVVFDVGDTVGTHGVVFQGNSVVDLTDLIGPGQIVRPMALNDAGSVVGFSAPVTDPTLAGGVPYGNLVTSQAAFAFLYVGGKAYNLNSLVTNLAGWKLAAATGINNAGQIVGVGYYQGQLSGFILNATTTPVTPPAPAISGVVGAGLSIPAVRQLTTNGLFTIFGSNFGPAAPHQLTAADLVNGALPTNMAQTCVIVGSTRVPLTYVSATQINAQAPTVASSGNVTVSVISGCDTPNVATSAPFTVTAAAAAPEFLYFAQHTDGKNPVAAIQASGGALVGAPGLISGLTTTPARAGDILTIFGVGFGATSPALGPGVVDTGIVSTVAPATVTIGGINAQVLYTGLTPTYAGLYQVNVVVPLGLTAGNQPVVIQVNGGTSPTGAYLTVQ